MTIQLFRVDERLIHGQVVIGWGSQLRPQHYVVIDDALAGSEWEQELYLLGLPDGVDAEFVRVSEARTRMSEWQTSETRTVILMRDLASVARLAEDSHLSGQPINLGGIHHGPGRVQVLPYLYLDEGDRRRLRLLSELGAHITARDLPGSKEVGLDSLLA
jgi:PTS system mannose-specific IIB component/fructoselysine and glucoselysine-specific PTS system IIB component